MLREAVFCPTTKCFHCESNTPPKNTCFRNPEKECLFKEGGVSLPNISANHPCTSPGALQSTWSI